MKRFVAGAVAGIAALTLTVGCAKQIQQLEPKLELKKAAEDLGATEKLGFTVKAGGSVDDLIAAAKKDSSGDEDPFTDADADMLRQFYNSSFTIAWDKAGEGVTDDRALINATVDGVTGAEIRVVDQVAYLKVPVRELAAKFGVDAKEVDQAVAEASAEVPGIGKLIDGGWVSVAASDLEKVTQGSGLGVMPSATSQADNDKIAAELKTSGQNLLDGADVVRDAADSTHLTVTTTTTKAFTELKRLIDAVRKVAPKEQAAILNELFDGELDNPPAEKPIVLDLWIDNGKFKAFEVNYLQFVDGAAGRASIRVEISTGTEITAPSGASKLDLAPIIKALEASGSGFGTGAAGGGDAKVWAELVGQQAVLSALTEGGKPATYLKKAAAETAFGDIRIKVVRAGVAQVNSGTSVACVTVPATSSGKSKVVEAAC